MRYALLLFAAVSHGATITTTAPGFTVGPVTFSNVTYTNTATEGLPFMGFGFVPDVYPAEFFPSNTVMLLIPGSYRLDPVGVGEAVSETLSADFSIAGYNLVGMSGLGVAFTDGFGTSESIVFSAPCTAFLGSSSGDGVVTGGCSVPPRQSGTISVTLDIHSDSSCNIGPSFCRAGVVHVAHVSLALEPVPEPGTSLLAGLGLALAARSQLEAGRSRS
jgi:hypothetical protein